MWGSRWMWQLVRQNPFAQFNSGREREGRAEGPRVPTTHLEIYPDQWKKPLKMRVTSLSWNQAVTPQRTRTASLDGAWALGGDSWANFS